VEVVKDRKTQAVRLLPWAATLLVAALLLPASAQAQKIYPSPEAAADAFTAAIASGKKADKNAVLGDDFREFLPTDEIDEEAMQLYLDAWKKHHAIVSLDDAPASKARAVEVGEHGWTLPIPLVKSKAGWSFDVSQGVEEMKTRRVGRNEIAVIQASLAYCDAQREYFSQDRNGNDLQEYAQRIISTPGEMDGLYWARLEDEDEESPLGPLFGDADPGSRYHGYHYRIVKSQGANAKGGARSYVVDGAMTKGFALVAWPAEYDDTGVMTFIVNQDEVVYEADLGPDTEKAAPAISSFDPDSEAWKRPELPADD
jgi:hypothetical protein